MIQLKAKKKTLKKELAATEFLTNTSIYIKIVSPIKSKLCMITNNYYQ